MAQSEIRFTSPEGKTYTARWSGNDETKEKALGVFHSPRATKSRVQDQGTKSPTIPLSFFFIGDDFSARSDAFWNSCDEIGLWRVDHPEDGPRVLNLATVTRHVLSVSESNMRRFTSSWIEPTTDEDGPSTAELKQQIQQDVQNLNIAAAQELENNISQLQQDEIQGFADSITNAIADAEQGLNDLFEESGLSGIVDTAVGAFEQAQEAVRVSQQIIRDQQNRFNEIKKSVTDAVDALADVALSPLTIGMQIQELIQSPARAVNEIKNRINGYGDTADLMIRRLTASPAASSSQIQQTPKARKNKVQTSQLAIVATLSGACLSTATGSLRTRTEAIEAATTIFDLNRRIVDNLDDIAETFETQDIENQFFSQTETFNRMLRVVGSTLSLLNQEIFNLLLEKRFTLTTPKSAIQVCVEEYGELGENDERLNFFLQTNGITDLDNFLLMPGREIVIYR